MLCALDWIISWCLEKPQGSVLSKCFLLNFLYRRRSIQHSTVYLHVFYYFSMMNVLWDELENYRYIPHCKFYIQCSCNVITSLKNYWDQSYVIWFLKGLNKKFSITKYQIMLMNPLTCIDVVFYMNTQQESVGVNLRGK